MDAFAQRMKRLGRAMAIYERFIEDGSGDQDAIESLLAENEDLADLLVPMLEDAAVAAAPQPTDPPPAQPLPPTPRPAAVDAVRHRSDTLQPGDQIGPYSVIEEIGAGGMGAVFLPKTLSGAIGGRPGRR